MNISSILNEYINFRNEYISKYGENTLVLLQNGTFFEIYAIINDEEVDFEFFRQLVDQTERSYNYSTIQALNLVWNQFLRNTIFDKEYEKLGIDAGKDQIEQIISSNQSIVQDTRFLNEAGFEAKFKIHHMMNNG